MMSLTHLDTVGVSLGASHFWYSDEEMADLIYKNVSNLKCLKNGKMQFCTKPK
jgi:hypothetical protein